MGPLPSLNIGAETSRCRASGLHCGYGRADARDEKLAKRRSRRIDPSETIGRGCGAAPFPSDQSQILRIFQLPLLHGSKVGIAGRHADQIGMQHHLETERMRLRHVRGNVRGRCVIRIVIVIRGQPPVHHIQHRLRRRDHRSQSRQNRGIQRFHLHHSGNIVDPRVSAIRNRRPIGRQPVAINAGRASPISGKCLESPLGGGDGRLGAKRTVGLSGHQQIDGRFGVGGHAQLLEGIRGIGGIKQHAAHSRFVHGHLRHPVVGILHRGADHFVRLVDDDAGTFRDHHVAGAEVKPSIPQ